jgi:predicted TPR repeat methyltransferase
MLFRRKKPKSAVHYSPEKIAERWSDLALAGGFLPTDTVLDMGCGEGVVSLEVAPFVARVHGVELKPQWVTRAQAEAKRRGLTNATFEAGSAITYQPEPYDVVLLLDVLNKTDDMGAMVGLGVLERLIAAAKRRMIVRLGEAKAKAIMPNDILPIYEAAGLKISTAGRGLIIGDR